MPKTIRRQLKLRKILRQKLEPGQEAVLLRLEGDFLGAVVVAQDDIVRQAVLQFLPVAGGGPLGRKSLPVYIRDLGNIILYHAPDGIRQNTLPENVLT